MSRANRLGISLAVFLAVLSSSPAAIACRWRYPELDAGQTATGTMNADSGIACTETLWSGPPYLQEIAVGTPPSHGKATTNGLNEFTYQSDPGYVGSDSFLVDVLYGHGQGYAKQLVEVTVGASGAPSEQLIVLLDNYVVVHQTQVHEKADATSPLVKTLNAGQRIMVVAQVVGTDWYLVSENDTDIGYVPAGDLAKAP